MFLALFTQNGQTAQSTATVEGKVLVRGASTVLPGARVELRSAEGSTAETYFAESTDTGAFRFANVIPGQYRLVAMRDGYVSSEYGQNKVNLPGVVFNVAPGARLTQMELALSMTGAISGKISYPTGHAAGIALVQVLRASYEDGRRTLTAVQSTRTDDQGNYRLFWLPPGRYFLSATPPNGPIVSTLTLNADATDVGLSASRANRRTVLTRPVTATKDDEIFAPIYFPGSPEERNAVAIDVVAGSESRGVDIVAGAVHTYRVRGVIVDSETGDVVKNAQVRATAGNQSAIVSLDPATGAFSIGRLPPGSEYVLTATAGAKSGRFRISIRDHDFEIRVPIYPSFSVSGRLMVDGRPARAEDVAGLRFSLQGDPTGIGGLQPSGAFAADGTFTFAVAPGDYWINVLPILNRTGILVGNIPLGNPPVARPTANTAQSIPAALKDVYVKSIRLGEKDVLNDGLHLDGPTSESIEIQLATHAGTLVGIVEDGKGVPAVNVAAVLVPDAPLRQRPDLYQATRTDGAGHFAFDKIPAGSYRIFAWEEILDGAWRDSDVIREYEARGTTMKIEDNRKFEAKVIVIGSEAR